MIKRFTLLLLTIMVSIGTIYAQVEVKGVVTGSDDGLGVPGVSVVVKGTTNGVSTDVEGKYVIRNTPSNGTLVFSAVGYITREVNIANRTSIDVVLALDEKHLEEVVVIGYGTVSADKHVGSSAQINADKISTRPNANALNAVIGAAPGVQTTVASGAPGSAPAIRVRGFGSINASNDALYVVDGVPYSGGTSNLNPDDIESISILKDASTTAIYGSRGANGVVMITTKRGKEGKQNLNFHGSYGTITRGLPEYETVNAQQYYPLMWESYRNSLHYGSTRLPLDIANQIASGTLTSHNGTNYSSIANLLGYNPFNVPNNQIVGTDGTLNPNAKLLYPEDLDWEKAVQNGGKSRQNYNLTYDGGTAKNSYFASFGYTKDEGFIQKSSLERWTGRVNATSQATSWLKLGINLSGTYRDGRGASSYDGSTYVNPFYYTRFAGPIYPIHAHDPNTGEYILDANGNKIYDMGDKRPFSPGRHSIWENSLNEIVRNQAAIGARTFATVQILPGLKATTNLTLDYQTVNEREFNNPVLGDGAPAGRAYNEFNATRSVTWNQILEYEKNIGKNNFTLLGGHESYAYKYNYLRGGRNGQVVDGVIELINFSEVLSLSAYERDHTIESYFSRLNWDNDGKYMASVSLRRDGNSRFAPAVRWANFWSLGGAYNIVKENFFNVPWVDVLKFRASYGQVGNDGGLGYYPYHALYTLGRNNAGIPGFTQANIPNVNITWETAKNFDIGVDFALFNRRLSGSLEYFDKVTDGLIFGVPVPFQNGSSTGSGGFEIDTNIGSLFNRGVEIQLNGQVVNTKNFGYDVTLNATSFKNRITKMPDSQKLIQSGTKAYMEGRSIYDFYLREYAGIDDETGAALYKSNTLTANSRIVKGDTLTTQIGEANYRFNNVSSIPDVYGSMNHNFRFYGFNLGVLFTYQIGGKVYDSAYGSLMNSGSYGNAMHVDILKRWTGAGTSTEIPRLDNAQNANFSGGSTRWLTSASYLQLNNVTLGYTVPSSITNRINAKNLQVYVSGENLFLLSGRKGMNVTGNFNGTVDNTYTFNKIFTGGVKIGF
jgi:TonB-linked SusC/RagA family outer membrane protein